MSTRFQTLLALWLATGLSVPIVIRHDRPDARYLALGERYRNVLVELNLPRRADPARRGGNGLGVLIAPHWVLTAAHVAADLRQRAARGDTLRVTVAGRDYAIQAIAIHESWTDGGPSDIALVRLATDVPSPRVASPWTARDEVGRVVTVVGSGDTGTGLTGPARADGRLRGATNRVEDAGADVLRWTFDDPSSPGTTDLEGISGPGDSGGPALLEVEGRLWVLGVSVAQDGMGRGRGRYGVVEYYTRVSSYADWIRQKLAAG